MYYTTILYRNKQRGQCCSPNAAELDVVISTKYRTLDCMDAPFPVQSFPVARQLEGEGRPFYGSSEFVVCVQLRLSTGHPVYTRVGNGPKGKNDNKVDKVWLPTTVLSCSVLSCKVRSGFRVKVE